MISSALSVDEGFSTLSQVEPDIILLDANIQGMDAYELLYRLRKNEITSHTPVIAITDEIMSVLQNASSELYFDYVLIKPIDIQHTWAVIHKMLNYAP